MLIGVYGASGFGREVMPIARRCFPEAGAFYFIDDQPTAQQQNGAEIVTWDQFCALDGEKTAAIAIADSSVREKLERRLTNSGVAVLNLIDPSVVIGDENEIGPGAILCGYCQITSNAKIGRNFHANLYSYVAHDCVIGDYVTFAPRVHCNGNVHIYDHAYIGTGAILKQGTPEKPLIIGEGAVIGMGAVVTKDVPAGETWVGNPARKMVPR